MRSPVPAMLTAPSAAAAVAKPLPAARSNTTTAAAFHATAASSRRDVITGTGVGAALLLALSPRRALAASDYEYVTETTEVIGKVRSTISMDKTDPKVADAVTELREMSNSWVAKYRREKALLGRQSFRDMYSALNAVSGHYISFGPTAPIPNKRRIRILEEMDAVEKSLKRGR